jgi:pyruvate kinase
VDALLAVRASAFALEAERQADIERVAEDDRPSARNLLHYLALRQHDIRPLQGELARRGLSSLGGAEGHVVATIDAVLSHFGGAPDPRSLGAPTWSSSQALLARHTVAALGPASASARARLMVTLPGSAATDAALVRALVEAGMDLARINTAHDDAATWAALADLVRSEAARAGRQVRVAVDLAGPKLRTGPLPPGPPVVKVRPRRGPDGVVQLPAHVRFTTTGRTPGRAGPDVTVVPVSGGVFDGARVGDEVVLRDTRGRRRHLTVIQVNDDGVDTVTDRTAYLGTGTELELRREGEPVAVGEVGPLPATDAFLRLRRGDRLRIRRGRALGEPATTSCELDDVFGAVAVGHRLLLDDGTIEAVVEEAGADYIDVRVARPQAAKLKAEKGINLPDTQLAARALTDEDREALAAVAPLADLVSLSFVQSPEDLDELRSALDELGHPDVPVGLKIEHAAAFEALPRLLLRALQGPPVAVMVARGDLAVEVGFDRLAEVQEEVLWLCEAAHLPVIWATQVAESMAKEGVPTRAEVTDAAWASRAECVMLNKGPHIVDAIHFLEDIFRRMQEHQDKRTSLLRRLSVSTALGTPPNAD